MSTRSNIGILNRDGSVEMIYCHWDGYPDWVGQNLLDHYNNEDRVRALMALGDISSIGPELGEKHDFDFGMKFECDSLEYKELSKQCNVYGRDRGETGTEARKHKTKKEALAEYANGWCEYFYLFNVRSNRWTFKCGDAQFRILGPKACKD